MTINLVVAAWLARYLGPSKYGVLNYAFAFVSTFQRPCRTGTKQHSCSRRCEGAGTKRRNPWNRIFHDAYRREYCSYTKCGHDLFLKYE